MKATRYPSYKAGLSKNISLLPEHWAELPLKRLFRLEKREPLESDEIVTAFRDGTVTLRKNRREDGFTNALKEIGYQRIHRNDLVIHAMDAFAGAIGVSDSDGKSSPVYSACTATKDANPYFYAYYLRDLALRGFIESLAKGIRERSTDFRWSDASMVAVPVPPQSEQLAIACFLDRETAKIDALIAEQQRLIELLQEKRQAVISHAVTKGLNPNAPMKESGVEWLGKVPEHWEVQRVKHLCTHIEQGWSPQCDNEASEGEDPGVLKVGCVNGGIFRPTENKRLPSELIPIQEYRVKRNDLLVSRANTKELVGSAAVATEDYPWLFICDKLYRVTVNPEIATPSFLSLYLSSNEARGEIQLGASGASQSMQNISQSVLMELPIALPDLNEQQSIKTAVASRCGQIESLIDEGRESVKLLQERRSALISAAVTGQIDVRGPVSEEAP